MQAELTSNVLKTGVVHCCVGQCSNTIPVDTVLTMKKLPITYVGGPGAAPACRPHPVTCFLVPVSCMLPGLWVRETTFV